MDVMIVIALTAVALVWEKAYSEGLEPLVSMFAGAPGMGIYSYYYHIFGAVPFLVASSIAILALRLRRPRPVFRQLLRQPGFIASLAVLFAITTAATTAGLRILASLFPMLAGRSIVSGIGLKPLIYFTMNMGVGGTFVALVWIVAVLGGRWAAERSWIDRAGRAIGWLWILYALLISFFGAILI